MLTLNRNQAIYQLFGCILGQIIPLFKGYFILFARSICEHAVISHIYYSVNVSWQLSSPSLTPLQFSPTKQEVFMQLWGNVPLDPTAAASVISGHVSKWCRATVQSTAAIEMSQIMKSGSLYGNLTVLIKYRYC